MAQPTRPTSDPIRPRATGPATVPGRVDSQSLDARARELEAIQELGRQAAEAASIEDLIDRAARLLEARLPLEWVAVAHQLGPRPEVRTFAPRSLGSRYRVELTRHLAKMFRWAVGSTVVWRFTATDFPEPGEAQKEFDESELVVVPVMRRGKACAYLAVKPERDAEESDLRLLYNAGNQLTVHLDRLLSAREAEEDRFRDVLGSMPQAVWLADRELRTLQANRASEELMASVDGVSTLAELTAELQLTPWFDRIRSSLSGAQSVEAALDGERVFNVSVSPLAAAEGPDNLIVVLTDVSPQRRLQQQLAQSEKMSSLGQMIAGVAHELNNPLATILTSAQLLRAWSDDERLGKRVRVLQEEADRCRKIVQNLLSFARKHDPEIKTYSLNELVQSTVALMSYPFRVAGIQVETRLDATIPALAGDPHQIRQVAVNLCNNARQAMEGRPGGRLQVRTMSLPKGGVRWEVEDNGPGVPEEVRRKIFDPFFTTKKEGEGTGLGLSIVYGIIEAHGGRIELLPAAGSGALFRIDLPLRDARRTETGQPAPVEAEPVPEPPASPAACRVLVLDDEPAFARMLVDALGELGHTARAEAGAESAWARLQHEEFDLVLMDLGLLGPAAHEWTDRVHERFPRYRGRILLTTADPEHPERDTLEAKLDTPLLGKPFDLETLLRRMADRMRPR